MPIIAAHESRSYRLNYGHCQHVRVWDGWSYEREGIEWEECTNGVLQILRMHGVRCVCHFLAFLSVFMVLQVPDCAGRHHSQRP